MEKDKIIEDSLSKTIEFMVDNYQKMIIAVSDKISSVDTESQFLNVHKIQGELLRLQTQLDHQAHQPGKQWQNQAASQTSQNCSLFPEYTKELAPAYYSLRSIELLPSDTCREEILNLMIMSQSLKNCIDFRNNEHLHGPLAQYALEALIAYENHDSNLAIQLMDAFFRGNHRKYVNPVLYKAYANLLLDCNRVGEAKMYLFLALEHLPVDIKIHILLMKIHKLLGENKSLNTEKDIISILTNGRMDE